jgi:Fe-S-cluster containining protein
MIKNEKIFSDFEHCFNCKAKCCKTGNLIGSPILSESEALEAKKISKDSVKNITLPIGKSYFILAEQEGTNRCPFLTRNNKCQIQNLKPLDCRCYPIKAIYNINNSIKFIIDRHCPATPHLSKKFTKEAKKIALESINRFDREIYNHWLKNNVGWVNDNIIELE